MKELKILGIVAAFMNVGLALINHNWAAVLGWTVATIALAGSYADYLLTEELRRAGRR